MTPDPTSLGRTELLASIKPAPIKASVHATSDPQRFRFDFDGREPSTIVQLGVALGPACRGAHLRGPQHGLVLTHPPKSGGGQLDVNIAAAVDGQLEVYAGTPTLVYLDGGLRDHWATSDSVAAPPPGPAVRHFHWSSPAPKPADGIWQVSILPMGDGCAAPAGLVASGIAAFAPGPLSPGKVDGEFVIDFGVIAASMNAAKSSAPDSDGTYLVNVPVGPPDSQTPHSLPSTPPPSPGVVSFPPSGGNGPAGRPPAPGSVSTVPPGASHLVAPGYATVPFKGTFYVRVVPRQKNAAKVPGGDGNPGSGLYQCAGPATNSVPITYGLITVLPPGDTPLQIYHGDFHGTADSPLTVDEWALGDTVDWNSDSRGVRHFHWTTTGTGTVAGEWQLASEPFGSTCNDSPGLLATGVTGFQAGTPEPHNTQSPPVFDVDFHALANKLATDRTYYLRVVPRGADGHSCTGPPSNEVTIQYLASGPGFEAKSPPPPQPPAQAPLQLEITKYQPFADLAPSPPYCFIALRPHDVPFIHQYGIDMPDPHDGVGSTLVWAGHGPHFDEGESFCYTPPDPPPPSLLDQIVDFVVTVVSFPSQVYELYKTIFPYIIGQLIQEAFNINCSSGSPCYQGLYIAEEKGLEALGLPPSLPDARALINDGEDYLVAKFAEDAGIPTTAAKYAYQKGKEEIIRQLATASSDAAGWTCGWCIFDNGVRTPTVNVRVTRPAGDTSSLPTPEIVCASDRNAEPQRIYDGNCAALPKNLTPGNSLVVPIHLKPHLNESDQSKIYSDCHQAVLEPAQGCTAYARDYEFGSWKAHTFASIPMVSLAAFTETVASNTSFLANGVAADVPTTALYQP